MSDRLTEELRAAWTGADATGDPAPDLLDGFGARFDEAVLGRSRRRRATTAAAALFGLALVLAVGSGSDAPDTPRFAAADDPPRTDLRRARRELPTLPRLPTSSGRLATTGTPPAVRSVPTLPRRPTGPTRPRTTPRPFPDAGSDAGVASDAEART
jgi:hypothetical protein